MAASEALRIAFDLMPLPMIVLNDARQIMHANQAFARTCGSTLPDGLVGLRPGEAVKCHHADRMPGGCGTTDACRSCGVIRANLAAAQGKAVSEDCRITLKAPPRELDVRVWTRPFAVAGEAFVVMTLIDVADEKRREALEQIFFHDVLNTAAELKAFGALVRRAPAEKTAGYVDAVLRAADRMVEQIEAQRDLAEGERGELDVHVAPVRTGPLLEAILEGVRHECPACECTLGVAAESADVEMATDRVLLTRVLANLAKNAAEACDGRGAVTIRCTAHGSRVEFHVHNAGVIPRDARPQIFQRSFSTKGRGRGLGAYSAKLLTERYLQGAISFETTERTGTTFIVALPRRLRVRPNG